jgi:transaldolase
LRIFPDTANVDEIRQTAGLGVVSGVTTNPSLASMEGLGIPDLYRVAVMEVAELADGPKSVEVINVEAEAKAGAYMATVPLKMPTRMLARSMITNTGLARFVQDWERAAKP